MSRRNVERNVVVTSRVGPARRGRAEPMRGGLLGLGLAAASLLPSVLGPGGAAKKTTGPATAGPPPAVAVAPAPAPPAGQQRIFFGNLHAHTKYSDGSGTPADAFARARDVGKLDFLAVTEHNHDKAEMGAKDRTDGVLIATQPELYNSSHPSSLTSAARAHTADGRFVAIAGQEFSTISSGNHVNVFDVGRVIDATSGDYAALYDAWLPQNPDSLNEPPLVEFNHPNFREDENPKTEENKRLNDYGLDDYGGDYGQLVAHAGRYAALIEIVSGPALKNAENLPVTSGNRHERDYWFYLNKGFRLAPTANQDNHYFNWGTTTRARTAVLADRLTKADLLRAMKARRVYATEDENLQIRLTVNGQPMGGVIRTPQPQDLDIQVDLFDPDEPDAQYEVELFRDDVGGDMIQDPAEEAFAEGNGRVDFGGQRFESGVTFLFVKVKQVGAGGKEDFAWTAPVWVELGPPLPSATPTPTPPPGSAPPTGAPPQGAFVHSRNSDIYHLPECADVARIKSENRVVSPEPPEDKTLHKNCPRVAQ